MNDELRDLLAGFALGLWDPDETARVARLVESDPEAAAELAAIRQALGESARWAPAIPVDRLRRLPLPEADAAPAGRRAAWLGAAAALAIGFAMGYLAGAGTKSAEPPRTALNPATPRTVMASESPAASLTKIKTAPAPQSLAEALFGPQDALEAAGLRWIAWALDDERLWEALPAPPATAETAPKAKPERDWLRLLRDPEALWNALPAPASAPAA